MYPAESVCQEQATQDARAADIIALAAHGTNRMPAEAEASLMRWVVAKRTKPCALVIFLDGDAQPEIEQYPSLTKLRASAGRNSITVMLHFDNSSCSEVEAASANIRHHADSVSDVHDQILHPPESYPHLGINE